VVVSDSECIRLSVASICLSRLDWRNICEQKRRCAESLKTLFKVEGVSNRSNRRRMGLFLVSHVVTAVCYV
jgi:hypothetical protein